MADGKIIGVKPDEIPFATTGLEAPTYYVDNIRGIMAFQGVVKLNMVETRADAMAEEMRAVHVVTIVLPFDQLKAWGDFLTKTYVELSAAVGSGEDTDGK